MELNTQLTTVQIALPPAVRPDQRPAADAAALNHASRPDVPLAIPPSNGQIAAISQSLMTTRADDRAKDSVEQVSAVQRTLKPYGISMLPQPPGENSSANNT